MKRLRPSVINCCVVLAGALLCVKFLLGQREQVRFANPVSRKYHVSLQASYPGLTDQEIDALLNESWTLPLAIHPDGSFTVAPFHGRFVTVHDAGFREVPDQGRWPIDRNRYLTIFLFGGSTAFNYGLPDDQTMAAFLQCRLNSTPRPKPVRVYNFGVGYFSSTQERQRFDMLVRQGAIPDLAIFLDGLNDFYYARGDFFNTASAHWWERAIRRVRLSRLGAPLRFIEEHVSAAYIAQRSNGGPKNIVDRLIAYAVERQYDDPQLLHRAIQRYLANKTAIEALAARVGTTPMFIWQPVPTYKYNLQLHNPFLRDGFGQHTYSLFGYPVMAQFIKSHPQGNNFVWCADIQSNTTSPLYIDLVHYSAKFSQLVAECIADNLRISEAHTT
ncbi:MAG: SGNH/GDSL hydrolase family protein [Candidatus Omnitrophica bacterium]|nr:SGNH/GDSL hydrolase family protein [Candidatus Omnitrophota bacterium]